MRIFLVIFFFAITILFTGCDSVYRVRDWTQEALFGNIPRLERQQFSKPPQFVTAPTPISNFREAEVNRIVDGYIELSTREQVRLIGIVYYNKESIDFLSELIVGRTVWLEPDGIRVDFDGRIRRYVWLKYPTNPTDTQTILIYQVNAIMLLKGYADIYYQTRIRNEQIFRRIVEERADAR